MVLFRLNLVLRKPCTMMKKLQKNRYIYIIYISVKSNGFRGLFRVKKKVRKTETSKMLPPNREEGAAEPISEAPREKCFASFFLTRFAVSKPSVSLTAGPSFVIKPPCTDHPCCISLPTAPNPNPTERVCKTGGPDRIQSSPFGDERR